MVRSYYIDDDDDELVIFKYICMVCLIYRMTVCLIE